MSVVIKESKVTISGTARGQCSRGFVLGGRGGFGGDLQCVS